jgi:hypothetical protein
MEEDAQKFKRQQNCAVKKYSIKEILENEDSDEEMYDYGKNRKEVVSI